jgi:hypothetical protein
MFGFVRDFIASVYSDCQRVFAETALNRLICFDADSAAGAVRHDRSPERTTYRNCCGSLVPS